MSLPTLDEIKSTCEAALPGVSLQVEGGYLVVGATDIVAVCRYLKDRFTLDYLANLTAIDYPPDRIEVVYHLYSMAKKHGPVALKVKLPRATPTVASVTLIWRGAEFQEREVYDLYGVTFDGHPDLRRILMWDGFQGHPMRKDYVVEDQNVLS
ncbi:MAG: NADH-quinone oxidoreductase subunit C [Candidatus Omnitrophica bacterium]|nr:NADH-quinone oxidoreductase subunit C [Candidatus Omnitrophota bacterium]